MHFRLLGPVVIEADDAVVTLPRRRERCLLAILLLEAGRTAPVERMIELLWDDEPPDNPRRAVHSHVARVRSLLAHTGAARYGVDLVSSRKGYTLTVAPERVDAHRFRALIAQAATTAELPQRDRLLQEARKLWRGPALHNAAPEALRERLCADLEELRLHAIEESMAVGLALRRHRPLLSELAQLTADHPTRERLIELYMIALYRSGRTSDALDAYARARARLRVELGLDPSQTLQRLHQAILRGDPISATDEQSTQPGSGFVRPAQLPARLPLALAIVAARATTDPGLRLRALADELRSLDALTGDDEATDLRAVFSWSYRALSPAAARLFRLLGLHPGPDISAPAAASLAAVSLSELAPLLAELTRAHLITEETAGRYAFHDLLRAYAMERADAEDSAADRRAARHRLLDHYLLSGEAAHRLLQASHYSLTIGPAQADVSAEEPGVLARASPGRAGRPGRGRARRRPGRPGPDPSRVRQLPRPAG